MKLIIALSFLEKLMKTTMHGFDRFGIFLEHQQKIIRSQCRLRSERYMKFGVGLINLYIVETHCINSDKMRNFTAIIYKEEDMYVAECSEVGTVSQGKTIEEAINNLKEATELYLEEFPFKEERKPLLTTFEVAVSAKA